MVTYTRLRPAFSAPGTVVPVEIKAPVCDTCEMTIKHTGIIEFIEERDLTKGEVGERPLLAESEVKWDVVRTGYAFDSL